MNHSDHDACMHWEDESIPEWLIDWWFTPSHGCWHENFDAKNCWLNIKQHFEDCHSKDEIVMMTLAGK